jgi:chromosome segregation ATPase
MNTPVRINALEVQDFKKVVAIALECDGEALTVIGGDNAQGKTTFLEAIAWAAGGDNFRPSQPVRDGAEELKIRVEFSNGVIAERTGEDGKLKVTDSTGKRGGQALLKAFISQFSLELDDFVNASAKEKAKMLLALYPELGPELDKLNLQIKATYDDRLVLGRQKDQKAKYAAELPFIPDAPLELLTGSEMTSQMQHALAHNAEVERLRNNKVRLNNELDAEIRERSRLRAILEKLNEKIDDLQNKVDLANKVAADATIMDTTAIQAKLEEMDAINAKVRTNAEKSRAERDAEDLAEQYSECSRKIETLRAKRLALLSKVEMPLPGLEISDDGDLVYNGRPWDGCSGAEQLKVAVAIAAAIKPECGFVLVDGLERMSKATLREFGEWATERNIQIIGTRVSDGDECSIIIEDGSIRF